MKVLNLYSGLGGNRKLWKNVEVTSIEINKDIAKVYSENFPNDTIIITDAHEFLHENYMNFDFIWSSPPCQSHSKMVISTRHEVRKYPEMNLYQEIILLQKHFSGRFVVENVVPYYSPLIKPSFKIDRHLFWSNFNVFPFRINLVKGEEFIKEQDPEKLKKWLGINYEGNVYIQGNHDPCHVLRNCVHPEIANHILNESFRNGLFSINDFT